MMPRPEDPQETAAIEQEKAEQAGKHPPAQFWQALSLLAKEPVVVPPLKPLPVRVMDADDYLPILLPQLAAELKEQDGWKSALSYSRMDDLRYTTLPVLAAHLRSYAVDGKLDDLMAVQVALTSFVMREMVRTGRLPVLVPFERIL